MSKKWSIAVDFDGVIHQYTSKFDINHLDPPMPGAFEWLEEMTKHFKVVIYSCRFSPKANSEDEVSGRAWHFANKALDLAEGWFLEHGLPKEVYDQLVFWQNPGKPTALVYVDDRAFRFEGTFPTRHEIHKLRPWKIDQKAPPAEWFCTKCGGSNVSFVDWYDPNADVHLDVGEYFIDKVGQGRGDDGRTHCDDCDESTPLEYRGNSCIQTD